VKVGLVVTGVLAVVDGSELEDAVAVGAAGTRGSAGRSSSGSGPDVRASAGDGLLGVRGRGGRGQREEVGPGSRGEGEELLRRKARHFEREVFGEESLERYKSCLVCCCCEM